MKACCPEKEKRGTVERFLPELFLWKFWGKFVNAENRENVDFHPLEVLQSKNVLYSKFLKIKFHTCLVLKDF